MAVTNVAGFETAPGGIAAFRQEVLGGGRQGLAYDGRLGELAVLWLKTLGLSLVTLGFYRFWGRTRIRKYLWSRVSLDGDRFEYDGTGGELFRRFLIAVVVLAPLLLLPLALEVADAPGWTVETARALNYLLLAFLALVGYYAGRRYRLTRTVWRGIRGGLGGRASGYAARVVWTWLLNVLTLGIYLPWQRVRLWRYEANNMLAGDARFAFDGAGRSLLRAWLVVLAGFVVLGLAIGGGVAVLVAKTDFALLQFVPLAVIFLLFLLWPLAAAHFTARWWSYMASNTRLGELTLAAQIRTWPVIRLQLGNLLLVYLTLGLGAPFAAHRTMKFWCRRLEVRGIETLEQLTQASPPPKAGAEGLSQLLSESGFA